MTDVTNYPIWATGAQHNFVQRPTSLSLQIGFAITLLDYWIHGQFLCKFKPGHSNSSQRSAVLEAMNYIFLQWRSMMKAKIGTSFDHKSLVFIKAMKRWNIFGDRMPKNYFIPTLFSHFQERSYCLLLWKHLVNRMIFYAIVKTLGVDVCILLKLMSSTCLLKFKSDIVKKRASDNARHIFIIKWLWILWESAMGVGLHFFFQVKSNVFLFQHNAYLTQNDTETETHLGLFVPLNPAPLEAIMLIIYSAINRSLSRNLWIHCEYLTDDGM